MIVTAETLNGTSRRGRVVRERLVLSGSDVASVRQFVARALDKEMPNNAKCSELLHIATAHFVLRELRVRGLSRRSRYDFVGIGYALERCCSLRRGLIVERGSGRRAWEAARL